MLRVAEHAERTDPGRQRRGNEDSLYAQPPYFAVADGMGGAQAGEVASRIAVEALQRGLPPDGPGEERLVAAVRDANEQIHRMSRADRERAGMGTTLTAAFVGPEEILIAHVGDSRAYRVRDGRLEPLTRDHSLVQALIDQGRLSEEEAQTHPQRSIITRALGPEPDVDVETHTYRARDGDVFLLCSDGLTSMVDEATVERIVAASPDLDHTAQALIDAANAAGGRDNITVILFRVADDQGGADGAEEQPTGASPVVAAPAAGAATAAPARAAPARAPAPAPAPPAARRPRSRGRRRAVRAAIVAVLVVVPIAVGLWVATRAVFFLGTDSRGIVTVYRGLPYELPFGVKLYESYYVSGMPAIEVAPARRRQLLDHSLRTQRDATNLVDQLELGRLESP